jgi:hypothetical protein
MNDQTLKVKPWAEDQGEYVLIDAKSYDENIHTLLDDGTNAAPKEGTAGFLKAKLDAAGVNYKAGASKAELQALSDQLDADAKVASLKSALAAKGVAFEETDTAEDLQAKLDAAE